jgi:hypothetical protein
MQSLPLVICALEDTTVSRHGLDAARWLAGVLEAACAGADHVLETLEQELPWD